MASTAHLVISELGDLSLQRGREGAPQLGEGKSFAKFVSKFAMLCIFPLREISCEI